MKQALSLLTLGVGNLEKSRKFYESLGWKAASESIEGGVIFFQANGFVLGLYPQSALTADMEGTGANAAPGGVTLGQNFEDEEGMRAGYAAFLAAGGSVVRAPFDAPWGKIAYAADPDGHVWEFAHVPGFEPDAAGGLTLPGERPA